MMPAEQQIGWEQAARGRRHYRDYHWPRRAAAGAVRQPGGTPVDEMRSSPSPLAWPTRRPCTRVLWPDSRGAPEALEHGPRVDLQVGAGHGRSSRAHVTKVIGSDQQRRRRCSSLAITIAVRRHAIAVKVRPRPPDVHLPRPGTAKHEWMSLLLLPPPPARAARPCPDTGCAMHGSRPPEPRPSSAPDKPEDKPAAGPPSGAGSMPPARRQSRNQSAGPPGGLN